MPNSWLPIGDDEAPDSSSQIAWLRSLGDREALFQILNGERTSRRGFEAAEALAQLGDVRGMDHLIAIVQNARSGLRMEAAEALQQLGHPRGLRALRAVQGETPSSDAATDRDEAYDDLSAATTDELMAIWHANDRDEWNEAEFEAIEKILAERLGRVPRRGDADDSGEDIDSAVDPEIERLWRAGDEGGLRRAMEHYAGSQRELEAAEALSALGYEDALDVIIQQLNDPSSEMSETAAEMLDWLDLPRGNAALREHGYSFETETEEAEIEPAESPAEPSADNVPVEPWATRVPRAPQTWGGPEAAAAESSPSVLGLAGGAIGGAAGFLFATVALHV